MSGFDRWKEVSGGIARNFAVEFGSGRADDCLNGIDLDPDSLVENLEMVLPIAWL